jgi:hypothetical protein
MRSFVLTTADSKEWLLDRAVAAALWAACVEPGSPLPEATWSIERTRKRQAMLNPEDSTSEFGSGQTPAR